MSQPITSMLNDAVVIEEYKSSIDDKAKLFLVPLDYILIADKENGLNKINEIINNSKTAKELINKFSNLKKQGKSTSLYKNVIPERFEELIQTINELDDFKKEKKLSDILDKIIIIVDESINDKLKEYLKKEKLNLSLNLYSLIKYYCNQRQSQVQVKKSNKSNNEITNNLESYLYPILCLKTKAKVSRYFIAPFDYLFYSWSGNEFSEKKFTERYNEFIDVLKDGPENIRDLDSRYGDKVSQTFSGEKNLKGIKDSLVNLENKNVYEMIIDIYQKTFEKLYSSDDKKSIVKIVNALTKACDEKNIDPDSLNITNDDIIYKRAAILFIALIKEYFSDSTNKSSKVIYPTLRNDVTYWHSSEVNNYLGAMEQYAYGSLQRFLALKQLADDGNLLAKLDIGSGYNYGVFLNDNNTILRLENNDFVSKQYLEFGHKTFAPGQAFLKKLSGHKSDLRSSRILIVDLVEYCERYLDLYFESENYTQFKEKINLQEFLDLLIHLSYHSLTDYHIKYCWYILTYHKYVDHQLRPIYIKYFFDENKDKLFKIFQDEAALISRFYDQEIVTVDKVIQNMNLEIDINSIEKLCGELKMIPNNILYYVGRLREERSFIEMGISKKDSKCSYYGLSFNTASLNDPNLVLKNRIKLFISRNTQEELDELRTKKIDILNTLIELQDKIYNYDDKIGDAYKKSRYDYAKSLINEQNEYKEMFDDLMIVLNKL